MPNPQHLNEIAAKKLKNINPLNKLTKPPDARSILFKKKNQNVLLKLLQRSKPLI